MNLDAVMAELKAKGTVQNKKTYKLHGAGGDVFGVSTAELQKLKKKIRIDNDLAMELWETGNSDARSLATMIIDPDEMTPTLATQWMKDVDYYLHGNEVAEVVARSTAGLSKMRQWRKQKSEYARATGYAILTTMLEDDPDSIDEPECCRILKDIVAEIHRSPNRARHAMVMAVIAIGVHKEDLLDEAIEAGEAIGEVEVDHGETDCSTPRIVPHIQKMLRRQKKA